jgi:hypothetical protein
MNVYVGLFFLAFSALSLEITLVRLLSVTSWYHLAFFVISCAMLGMTAGAVHVYFNPEKYTGTRLAKSLWTSSIFFAVSIPLMLVLLCILPLIIQANVVTLIALMLATISCGAPFYFAGTVVSAVLSKHDLPIGKLYMSDLLGAASGSLFVLAGMEIVDAPSLILLSSSTAAVASLGFSWKIAPRFRIQSAVLLIVLLAAGILNSVTTRGIRPLVVKGKIESAEEFIQERWNSYSRVAVGKQLLAAPPYWGPSPVAPQQSIVQYSMRIDGGAGTSLQQFHCLGDIDHLKYDVTNIAYYLQRPGETLVIGVGAGRDVQSALLFGQKPVVGIEINPIFIDLLNNDFRDFAGLADRKDVTLVTAEARNYLAQHQDQYAIMQMSLIDTWAATGAGAYSLSENSLYTVEAWQLFLSRLTADGIFTVSRWHSPEHIGEAGRALSLAVAALLKCGIKEPSRHIAMITAKNISTLLVCKSAFTPKDLTVLAQVSRDLQFTPVILPGAASPESVLQDIVSAKSHGELLSIIGKTELNFTPTTYENPYFFNMLRLNHLRNALRQTSGVMIGNLIATVTLLTLLAVLLFFSVLTIILPILFKSGQTGYTLSWSPALYFSAIGAGFMLTEIALIQRLTILLSHPVYALGVLLFTLIASTGVGSLLSERLPLTRKPWIFVFPVATALFILGLKYMLTLLLATLTTEATMVKIAATVLVISPTGLMLGLFFPTGLRLVKMLKMEETPWYLALNGIFGVFCSALAVFISIYISVSANFYLAALCYAIVLIAVIQLQKRLPAK